MFIVTRLSQGLLFACGLLLLAFVIGTLMLPQPARQEEANEFSAPLRLAEALVSTAFGLSLIGFALYALGMTQTLTPHAILLALCSLIALPIAARASSVAYRSNCRLHFEAFKGAWDTPAILVLLGMLVLSIPAVLPNSGGDPTTYHLVYALEWALTHGIHIDPFLIYPIYANNFLLFHSALFAFGVTNLVNFLPWGMGLLSALGILCAIRISRENGNSKTASWIACALTAAVMLSPVQLRWMDTGYIDAALGSFMLMTLLALQLALRTRERSRLLQAALIGGFLIGMKGSFFLLIPLVVLLMVLTAHRIGAQRAFACMALLIFIACASPWYIRNALVCGDPISPTINLALRGDDLIFTKDEWHLLLRDLIAPRTVGSILSLPLRAVFSSPETEASIFRDYGTNFLMPALFLPFLWLLRLASVWSEDGEAWLYACASSYLCAYWIATATYLRYSMLFMPVLGTAVGLLALRSCKHIPAKALLIVPASCLLLAFPSAGSWPVYRDFFLTDIRDIASLYTDDRRYLMLFGNDYADEQHVVETLRRRHIHGKIYSAASQANYYYRLDGFESIGSWVGPSGLLRLRRAIMLGCAPNFLERLDISAVLVPPKLFEAFVSPLLTQQLRAARYEQVSLPQNMSLFLRPAAAERKNIQQPTCASDPNWFLPSLQRQLHRSSA